MFWKQNIIIIARILAPLTLLINPVLGIGVSLFFDCIDVIVWDKLHVKPPLNYHRLDKLLDNWILFIAAALSPLFIPAPYLYFAYFLFMLRIVMSTVFIITGKQEHRRLLLIGPNWFPWYFTLFGVMDLTGNYGLLQNNPLFILVVVILFICGYVPEIVLHYKKIKVYQFLKKYLHRYFAKNEG